VPLTAVAKCRIDQLLVEKHLAPSRERAQSLIMAGHVLVNDVPVTKPGHKVAEDAVIRVKGEDHPYVGRGGVKLAGALDYFKIDPSQKICADIGSSTGGFTDCLLQRGAAKVYAVDVGTNQLAWKLRQDPRVVVMEKTHVKNLPLPVGEGWGEGVPTLVTIDCSFISLTRVLPEIARWVMRGTTLIALIKPQFEVGPEKIGKGGIVKDASAQQHAIDAVFKCATELDWEIIGTCNSPITGTDGNREYFIALLVK
jgi:23S rRNA (cytidine1920-2'-O)/16S rRNA (cytidine1409-2'-O)-methyltransferase